MSDHIERSAIDSLVDQNMSLRDEVDELTDERDAAVQRAESAAERVPTDDGPNIGYVAGDGDAGAGAGDESEVSEIEMLRAERDTYLADSQRLAADFANYRKQSDKRVTDAAASQSAGLVRSLLPVLDACDSALELDNESTVGPIRSALLGELERSGLDLMMPDPGDAFDPELHEAVMHETEEDDASENDAAQKGARVAEVFRAGYVWKGRVVRPAMVKVIG